MRLPLAAVISAGALLQAGTDPVIPVGRVLAEQDAGESGGVDEVTGPLGSVSRPGRAGGRRPPGPVSSDERRRLGGVVEQVLQGPAAEEAGPDRGEHDRPEDEHEQRHP